MNEKINVAKNEILVLHSDLLLKKEEVIATRNDVIEQMKDGVVVIPNGFDFAILDRSVFLVDTKNEDEKDVLEKIIDYIKRFAKKAAKDSQETIDMSDTSEYFRGKFEGYESAIRVIKTIGGIK